MEKHGFNLSHNKLKVFKAGTFIFLEGDPATELYLIKSGLIELRRKFNTGEIVIGKYGPGEFLGLVSAVEKWYHTETAEVVEDAEVFLLETSDLEEIVVNNPATGFKIVNHLSNQLRELDIKLDKLSRT